MTRQDSIKSEIAENKKKMEAINTITENEKRVKTEVERSEFTKLTSEVQKLQSELSDLEAVERIKIDAPVIVTGEQKEKNKRYNVSKAINEFAQGRLSGLENEMHQEALRTNQNASGLLIPNEMIYKRTETFANSTGLYTQNAVGLDIIAPVSMIDKLGITQYPGLTSTYKFNYAQGVSADTVAEGSSLSGKTYTKVTDEIVPTVYGYTLPVSKQALAVTSMVSEFILDADNAINSKLLATLLAAINVDQYALASYSGTTTGVTMTSSILGKLKASVLSSAFRNPAFVMGSDIYAELENTAGVTSIKTLIENGKINGVPAFDVTTLLAVHNTYNYDIIFGDWARAYVGFWGSALEVLVDPFTYSDTQVVKLTFSRLADWSFNPYTFKCVRRAILA